MPSTPIYAFPYPSNVDLVRDGHQDIQDLATSFEGAYNVQNGLVGLKPSGAHTNIAFDANGVGRPTVGASTFTIANCFSTTYDAYKVTWIGGTSTTGDVVSITYPGVTTNYVNALVYNRPNNGTVTGAMENIISRHTWIAWGGSTIMIDAEIYLPAQSSITYIYSRYIEMNSVAGAALGHFNGVNNNSTSVTGLTITLQSGVIVNQGTVRVYAYNK